MLEIAVARRIGRIDLRIELSLDREAVLVAGPNGAGKSTLLRLLLGVLSPDAGRIALDGRVLFDAAAAIGVAAEDRELGYLPQDYALFPHLDVIGNAIFGLARMRRADRARHATSWLERLGVGHLSQRFPAALSGGERQRVAKSTNAADSPRRARRNSTSSVSIILSALSTQDDRGAPDSTDFRRNPFRRAAIRAVSIP